MIGDYFKRGVGPFLQQLRKQQLLMKDVAPANLYNHPYAFSFQLGVKSKAISPEQELLGYIS
jgi:hypothetical protein